MDKINVAVIGTGAMGKSHARIYANMKNTNLVAVCDVNEEIANSTAKKYDTKFCTDYISLQSV